MTCATYFRDLSPRPGGPQRAGGLDPAARGRGGRGRDGDPRRKVRGVQYSTVQYSTVQ